MKTEVVARLGRCRIEKQYDFLGQWDYVLLCDDKFVERSWKFEKLRDRMYGKPKEK